MGVESINSSSASTPDWLNIFSVSEGS